MADEKFIESPPEGLDGWREVWREDRRVPAEGGGIKGALRGLLRRMIRSGGREDEARQRDFNIALLDMMEDRRRDIAAAAADLESARASLELLLRTAVERNDALLLAVDAKVETALARIRDLALPRGGEAPALPSRSDWLYRRLEESLRGSESEVREALRVYLERARTAQPLVDVGCGRGELLELCREAGIEARGFDTNERSVADLRDRGLHVAVGAIPECLRALQPGSVGSVFASHVVEHLPFEALIELFAESRRILRPGGLLMIETPNARALAVSAAEFWRDPTHLAPRHVAALTLLAREYGFTVEEAAEVHPFPQEERLRVSETAPSEVRALARQLDEILYRPQDLRLVLKA